MTSNYPSTEEITITRAAYQYVESQVPKADDMKSGVYPLWHGWALREAFEAGAKFSQDQKI